MIEPEQPSSLRSIEMIEDQAGIFRLAIGREAHHLVLARIDLEAGVVGESRIEQAERMRKVDLACQLERVAAADSRPTSSSIPRRRPASGSPPPRTAKRKNADAAWLW